MYSDIYQPSTVVQNAIDELRERQSWLHDVQRKHGVQVSIWKVGYGFVQFLVETLHCNHY